MFAKSLRLIVTMLLLTALAPLAGYSLTFAEAENYNAGLHPYWLAIADFDEDMDLDLAVTNYVQYQSGDVSVLENEGTGAFMAPESYPDGMEVHFIIAGDLNADGAPDLVVSSTPGAAVRMNDGHGAFLDEEYLAGVDGPSAGMDLGDLDGDSVLDLVVANSGYGGSGDDSISVLIGDGDGTFQNAVTYPAAGTNPYDIRLADLDGDADLDMIVVYSGTDNLAVSLYENGAFQTAATYATGDMPRALTTGDFDGDSDVDVAVACEYSNGVCVHLGNGDGTFAVHVEYAVGEGPDSLTGGDLDDDGIADLVVATNFDDAVSILCGNPDGTFQPAVTFAAGDGPSSVVLGDLDFDQDLDIAVSNFHGNNVSILINTTGFSSIHAGLSCAPSVGTVPFMTSMTVTLTNNYLAQVRRMAARIDVATAGGSTFSNWRAGYANIYPGSSFITNWGQLIPALTPVIGENIFTLQAEDVTPSPYNQPPYPPSGDSDADECTITALAP